MIKKYSQLAIEEDYKGQHQAPTKEDGAPLWDVTQNGIYPEDFYGPSGAKYYSYDTNSSSLIYFVQRFRNKPNALVKIYRAVPKRLSLEDQIFQYEQEKKYILKYGKLPSTAEKPNMNHNQYFEYIHDKIENLKGMKDESDAPIKTINRGDWVTISRQYAKEHGTDNLKKNFKIISKNVFARDVFTSGDSIEEWGYDPQPRVEK